MSSIDRGSRRWGGSKWVLFAAALQLTILTCLVTVVPAVAQDSGEDLKQEIQEHFRVLVLRDGVVLQPLAEDLGIETIELTGPDVAVDGTMISNDELEARFGDLAAAVEELAALDPEDRRALFAGADPAAVAEAESEAAEDSAQEGVARAEREGESRESSSRRSRRERSSRSRADNRVVVASALVVEEDEVSRDVVVFGGALTVRGRVIGDAAAIGGSAVVSGEIDGDLAVVGGSIRLEEGAEIRGDVVSVGGMVERADDVEILGEVVQVPFNTALSLGDWDWDFDWDSDEKPWKKSHDHDPWRSFSPFGHMFKIGWAIVGLGILALLSCLVYLLAGSAVERVGWKVVSEPWKSGLVGLLAQVLFFPLLVMVCLVLVVSVIGIPLLILVPFAILGLVLISFLGYTAVAHRVGGGIEQRFGWSLGSPYWVLLVGILAIQIWSLLGDLLDFGWGPLWFFAVMFAVIGCLIVYVAWTVGFGAAILTRFGTASGWGQEAEASLPPAPPGDWQSEESTDFTDSAPPEDWGAEEAEEPPEVDTKTTEPE